MQKDNNRKDVALDWEEDVDAMAAAEAKEKGFAVNSNS
jgi:hypothetical protein